jgi:signal transduction histidine kinase
MKFVTRLPGRAERTIASARVVLAVFTLFAIWLDPSEPSRNAALTYGVLMAYVAYAVIAAAMTWRHPRSNWLVIAMHVVDIAIFTYLIVLTQGPASPLFVYSVFSLFSGALRWGSRGALATTAVVLAIFISVGIYASRVDGPGFELNRFIIRIVYLGVVSALLIYLCQHEERMREDIAELATWPRLTGDDVSRGTEELLRYAMGIVGATHGAVVWESGDEPWLNVRVCDPATSSVTRYQPAHIPAPVAETLRDRAFMYPRSNGTQVAVGADGSTVSTDGAPLVHPEIAAAIPSPIVSAPFYSEHISGRILFGGIPHATLEALPLTTILAREAGASLEHLYAREQARHIAISEERIRLARDLHDGVLQALTGVRLEIQNVALDVETADGPHTRDRLLAIERAIALEQRELRSFIAALKPYVTGPQRQFGTAARLHGLVERTERQWKLPVILRVNPPDLTLADTAEQAVSLIINEAITNAARHAHPSRVSVDVTGAEGTLRVVVADDGRGFPFHGRFDHQKLAEEQIGPVSLRERLTAMRGALTIESTPAGSRLEMTIPLPAEAV